MGTGKNMHTLQRMQIQFSLSNQFPINSIYFFFIEYPVSLGNRSHYRCKAGCRSNFI